LHAGRGKRERVTGREGCLTSNQTAERVKSGRKKEKEVTSLHRAAPNLSSRHLVFLSSPSPPSPLMTRSCHPHTPSTPSHSPTTLPHPLPSPSLSSNASKLPFFSRPSWTNNLNNNFSTTGMALPTFTKVATTLLQRCEGPALSQNRPMLVFTSPNPSTSDVPVEMNLPKGADRSSEPLLSVRPSLERTVYPPPSRRVEVVAFPSSPKGAFRRFLAASTQLSSRPARLPICDAVWLSQRARLVDV
jgi:hypothetical protein